MNLMTFQLKHTKRFFARVLTCPWRVPQTAISPYRRRFSGAATPRPVLMMQRPWLMLQTVLHPKPWQWFKASVKVGYNDFVWLFVKTCVRGHLRFILLFIVIGTFSYMMITSSTIEISGWDWQLETVENCISAVMRVWSFMDCVLVTLNISNSWQL